MLDPNKEIFDVVRSMIDTKGFTSERIAALDAAINSRVSLGLSQSPAVKSVNSEPAHTNQAVPYFRVVVDHLDREEGRKPSAYQDHLGFWTIGVGRLIDKRKGGRLTNAEIDMLLANDIAEKVESMKGWPAWERVKDDPVRGTALISMCFQLGTNGLAAFKNSLALIAYGNWDSAADNLLQSLWAKQTPERAKRVTAMIRTGKIS